MAKSASGYNRVKNGKQCLWRPEPLSCRQAHCTKYVVIESQATDSTFYIKWRKENVFKWFQPL